MSQKVYDNKNRWRSKVVAFRVSPEEWDELEDKIKLCGYGTKQDYILDCLYNSEIKAMGNPMMLTQFRKDFRRMREELEEADITKEIIDKLTESIKNMERILEAFMIENEAVIKAKSEKKKVKIVRP